MDEQLEDMVTELRGSLRRAEHSYYVSLKYTRTVDVIRNLIERIISTYVLGAEALLLKLRVEQKIPDAPENLIEKLALLKEHISDEVLEKNFETLLFLRRIMRASYTKEEEYRRHVTMHTSLDGEKHEFHIDNLQEYYDTLTEFVRHILGLLHGKEE